MTFCSLFCTDKRLFYTVSNTDFQENILIQAWIRSSDLNLLHAQWMNKQLLVQQDLYILESTFQFAFKTTSLIEGWVY